MIIRTLRSWEDVRRDFISDNGPNFKHKKSGFVVVRDMLIYFGGTYKFYTSYEGYYIEISSGWVFLEEMFVEDDFLKEEDFEIC